MSTRGASFVEELAKEVIQQLKAGHVCVHEGEIATLIEAMRSFRDDAREMKDAVREMRDMIQSHSLDITAIKTEKKTAIAVIGGLVGALGGGGIVGAILKLGGS